MCPARSICPNTLHKEWLSLRLSARYAEGSNQVNNCAVTLQPHPAMVLVMVMMTIIMYSSTQILFESSRKPVNGLPCINVCIIIRICANVSKSVCLSKTAVHSLNANFLGPYERLWVSFNAVVSQLIASFLHQETSKVAVHFAVVSNSRTGARNAKTEKI